MQWNEVSKKTIGVIVAIGVLFAGAVLVIAFVFLKQRGGYDVARMVRDAVDEQRVIQTSEGQRFISDRLLVTLHPSAPLSALADIARSVRARIGGAVVDQEYTYVVLFTPVSARQLRQMVELFKRHPDVVDAAMIPAE